VKPCGPHGPPLGMQQSPLQPGDGTSPGSWQHRLLEAHAAPSLVQQRRMLEPNCVSQVIGAQQVALEQD